ncbi:MAG: endonuclease/exonuclease/phosphatase family protein [Lachnospiraceae bacterium]
MSEDAVYENIAGSVALLDVFQPDFIFVQEIDVDSTRSYHIDQKALLAEAFSEYETVFAYNYLNSPFLMWPLYKPIGTITTGMATYSRFSLQDAVRRSLPVMDNFNKYVDLDRCYTKTRVPVENGFFLCLYNVHLSAYGNDGDLRERQVSMLLEDMKADYAEGNYIICGGDFNHDLKLSEKESGVSSWAQPFPRSMLPEEFRFAMDFLSEERIRTMVNSSRDSGEPYDLYKTETYMLDGFLISDNVEMVETNTVSNGFKYSDHNPVILNFILKEK